MREFLKRHLSSSTVGWIRFIRRILTTIAQSCIYFYGRFIKTPINLRKNNIKQNRKLEIGSGTERIPGFETLNVVLGRNVDYVADASKKLPFAEGSFQIVYASHILEHIPWYTLKQVIKEWNRIISPGGFLEIWVPNGLLIAKTFVDAEEGFANHIEKDGWYKFNDDKDPCIWANGRIFSYGDGTGRKEDPNWHLTIFSPRFLKYLLKESGFIEIEQMDRTAVRGYDHGWINLGLRGRKP